PYRLSQCDRSGMVVAGGCPPAWAASRARPAVIALILAKVTQLSVRPSRPAAMVLNRAASPERFAAAISAVISDSSTTPPPKAQVSARKRLRKATDDISRRRSRVTAAAGHCLEGD